ncbi:uncharacterized protein LOC131890459 [Tigriopus californicus]|uniref:uncharacterized protein LOC131890459 n=1 Tax=Tigriopus californicus TaxID=6832 RepID=UPI0027DA63A8|nr:uncharacterized protein LOC131890459 [Tigriopus californicus]|eukprot:TCALIF_10654-PA protein Name:"Protein of unknown function" AED:0.23 eAED:0.23 QI:67/1/0.5/1/1/1/2/0/111
MQGLLEAMDSLYRNSTLFLTATTAHFGGTVCLALYNVQEGQEGREEGRTKGREEGRTKGRTKGRAEGRTLGYAEGRADGILEGVNRTDHIVQEVIRGLEAFFQQGTAVAGG